MAARTRSLWRCTTDSTGVAGDIERAPIVFNLVEAMWPSTAAAITRTGAMLVETSAEPGYLDDVRDAEESTGTGRAVLNVGVDPGFTEIIAADFVAANPTTHSVSVALEIGMGHRHGRAAIEWALRNLDNEFPMLRDGRWAMGDGRWAMGDGRWAMGDGRWTAGRTADRVRKVDRRQRRTIMMISFGFADQVAIGRAHELTTVETVWHCPRVGLPGLSAASQAHRSARPSPPTHVAFPRYPRSSRPLAGQARGCWSKRTTALQSASQQSRRLARR